MCLWCSFFVLYMLWLSNFSFTVSFFVYGDHLDLHVLTHSFPTRRSSDLLDPLLAELIVDHQFAAVIGVGLLQKERRGKVAADTEIAAAPDPHRTIDMRAERLAAFVAIEQRRKEIGRASCRERVCQYVCISVVALS